MADQLQVSLARIKTNKRYDRLKHDGNADSRLGTKYKIRKYTSRTLVSLNGESSQSASFPPFLKWANKVGTYSLPTVGTYLTPWYHNERFQSGKNQKWI